MSDQVSPAPPVGLYQIAADSKSELSASESNGEGSSIKGYLSAVSTGTVKVTLLVEKLMPGSVSNLLSERTLKFLIPILPLLNSFPPLTSFCDEPVGISISN